MPTDSHSVNLEPGEAALVLRTSDGEQVVAARGYLRDGQIVHQQERIESSPPDAMFASFVKGREQVTIGIEMVVTEGLFSFWEAYQDEKRSGQLPTPKGRLEKKNSPRLPHHPDKDQ